MARNDPQFNVRMPADLKEKLTTLAEENGRSINAEIVKAIEDAVTKYELEKKINKNYTAHTMDVRITDPYVTESEANPTLSSREFLRAVLERLESIEKKVDNSKNKV
ncbi:Arc family DNA-binding protein [Yersinia enterocolitica]|nr:Arc family DNA-binding protein [Yersinia enterocolitica]EKN5936159.1 Arc family DNA-binding protein [Yersinia enterocolitica]EKN6368946.1 Arc family DNA-binding protein [Yersinia enterocolitica]ELI7913468.1 Arc family DNA-binding protein [Yersinia enterocolitica]ELI7916572.1 Arc family DNA-binding protein [Yersinia enterocolitica]